MRISAILTMLGACGVLSTTACASMQKMEKEVASDVKEVGDVKKDIAAIKKGDVGAVGDAAATVAVKGALGKDEKTRTHAIEVESKGGVITLKGNAPADVRSHAEQLAKGVPGVTKVVNDIKAK